MLIRFLSNQSIFRWKEHLSLIENNKMIGQKNLALEGARGVAALVVLIWHTLLAFSPEYSGIFQEHPGFGLQGSLVYAFINGPAAVSFFFVLSGYVLTKNFFSEGNFDFLVKGVIKRYPRLMLPVFISIILSYLLFKFGFYFFESAGLKSNSPWLIKFGYAYDLPFPVYFSDALSQGLFLIFFRGDSYYNSSLWTMRGELIGSLIAYGISPFLYSSLKYSRFFCFFLMGLTSVLIFFSFPQLLTFLAGVSISIFFKPSFIFNKLALIALSILSFYLFGYGGNAVGIYSFFSFSDYTIYNSIPHIIGAVITIILIESCSNFSNKFTLLFCKLLGIFSFPVYLVHLLVIASLGSFMFINYGVFWGSFVSIVGTFIMALPFVWINFKWIFLLNKTINSLVKKNN